METLGPVDVRTRLLKRGYEEKNCIFFSIFSKERSVLLIHSCDECITFTIVAFRLHSGHFCAVIDVWSGCAFPTTTTCSLVGSLIKGIFQWWYFSLTLFYRLSVGMTIWRKCFSFDRCRSEHFAAGIWETRSFWSHSVMLKANANYSRLTGRSDNLGQKTLSCCIDYSHKHTLVK